NVLLLRTKTGARKDRKLQKLAIVKLILRVLMSIFYQSTLKRNLVDAHAEHIAFSDVPRHLATAVMPHKHVGEYQPQYLLSRSIVVKTQNELDHFTEALQRHGTTVYRPAEIHRAKLDGYTKLCHATSHRRAE
ncbi:hypothetical protein LLEC1_00893, partial [Akanthomyces lecanii]